MTSKDYRIIQARAGQVLMVTKDAETARVIANRLKSAACRDPFRFASGAAWTPLGGGQPRESPRALSARVVAQRMQQLDVDPGEYPTRGKLLQDPIDRVRVTTEDAPETYTATAANSRSMKLGVRVRQAFHVGQQYRFGLAEHLYVRWCCQQDRNRTLPAFTLSRLMDLAQEQPRGRGDGPFPHSRFFMQDFQALGQRSRLPGYIAVIEADGIGFGGWMGQFTTPEDIELASDALYAAVMDSLVQAVSTELRQMDGALQQAGRSPVVPPTTTRTTAT